MYLAYPAPDDEELALASEPLQAYIRTVMQREPARFRMRGRRRTHRLPPCRRGSDDPLRLARSFPAKALRATPRQTPVPDQEEALSPQAAIRQALAAARQNGLTLEALAERVGISERTLRRRLKDPQALPLGEYCHIVSAGQMNAEGE